MFYHKGSNIQLSKNFNLSEFDCKCKQLDCTYALIHMAVIRKLEDARTIIKKPFKITSGFRCQNHNKLVGGVKTSQHMIGAAADVVFPPGVERPLFIATLKKIFPFIKVYEHFIHCDIRLKNTAIDDNKSVGPRTKD